MNTTTEHLIIRSAPKGCILETKRIVNATGENVFKAWTDPTYLTEWFGPKGFTNTIQSYDLRPGGSWKFIMHGPDGVDYPNENVFVHIEAPSRLVWNHVSGHFFQVVATFEKVNEHQTRVTFQMIFETEEECARVTSFAKDKNEENLDKLELILIKI